MFVYLDIIFVWEIHHLSLKKKLSPQYDLKDLKSMCFSQIHPGITVGNATDVLILADTHDVAKAKTEAIGFIRK